MLPMLTLAPRILWIREHRWMLKNGVKVSMCSCLFIVIIYLYIYYNYYIFIFLDQKNNTLRRDTLYVHGFTNNGGPPVNMANMANMVNKWHEHGEHLWWTWWTRHPNFCQNEASHHILPMFMSSYVISMQISLCLKIEHRWLLQILIFMGWWVVVMVFECHLFDRIPTHNGFKIQINMIIGVWIIIPCMYQFGVWFCLVGLC